MAPKRRRPTPGRVRAVAQPVPVEQGSSLPATTLPATTLPETTLPETTLPETTLPSRRLRWCISVLVVVQLLAVAAEPFRFFTSSPRGTSPLSDPVRYVLGPYIEFAYLNHGYFFFAPEPGPSHLIECRLSFSDRRDARVRYPDRLAQWPRLLYHRHFMLTENLNQLHVPPVDPQAHSQDPALARSWAADRARYEMVRDSMANHLSRKHGAESVTIERIEHQLPSSAQVLEQGLPLNDPSLYITLPDAPLDPLADPSLPPAGPVATPPAATGPLLPLTPPDTGEPISTLPQR